MVPVQERRLAASRPQPGFLRFAGHCETDVPQKGDSEKMQVRRNLALFVGILLVAAPAAGASSQAEKGQARTGGTVRAENLRGGMLVPLAAAVAVILLILAASGADDTPISP